MTGKDFGWGVAYYAVVLTMVWLASRDGPPLKLTILYHAYRAAQNTARTIGTFGLLAEHAYHKELAKLGV